MGQRNYIGVLLIVSLLANAFSLPIDTLRLRRQSSSDSTNEDSTTRSSDSTNKNTDVDIDLPPPIPYNDDDDDDSFGTPQSSNTSSGGGSNLFSLLNLVTAFLPGSSTSNDSTRKFLKEIFKHRIPRIIVHKQDKNNDIDYIDILKPTLFLRQENKRKKNSKSNPIELNDENSAENSLESDEDRYNSNQESNSNIDTNEDFDNDSDYDEPPGGGDGEGGGLLGLLAGLSGGEDGQSDLGSLLATISGIIANLSGDGIDLNSLIASGIGLFVGLLSEGEANPGEIIASYLLTSLDTITGGGAKNNGAFFGKFLIKLLKGTSAATNPDVDSDENGNQMETKDSAGFFVSFLMALLGDMSKGSSGYHPSRRYIKNIPKLLSWLK